MAKKSTSGVTIAAIKQRTVLIVLFALVAASYAYPSPANRLIDGLNHAFGFSIGHIQKGFVLGLDLQGGTRLEYEADVTKVPPGDQRVALDGVRDVVERRVNAMGVAEPLVTTAQVGTTWRVSAELAGVRDIRQAITMIGETPILEFKEQGEEKSRELTPEEQKMMSEKNAAARTGAEEAIARAIKDPVSFSGIEIPSLAASSTQSELYDAVKNAPVGVVRRVIPTASQDVAVVVEEKKTSSEFNVAHILIQYVGAPNASASITRSKDEAKQKSEELRKTLTAANFATIAKTDSEDPGSRDAGGDLGWFRKGVMVDAFEKAAVDLKSGEISQPIETPFGYHLLYKKGERTIPDVHIKMLAFATIRKEDLLPPPSSWKFTGLTGKQLKRAVAEYSPNTNQPEVSLQFDEEGTKLFAEITKRNLSKPVAIFLDGQPISTPVVQSEIANGNAVISGSMDITEAKLLAQRLQAGALPVPIKLIAQQSVGPTLGSDSVNKSLLAGLYGFLFVALFMLAWYRGPGFFAILSLGMYAGLSFAIFKILPVTLSLSGIAGFVLSLGIAVDANVLVFERLKEELKSGKSYRQALEEAFQRAWPSIRDGNTTTLISCLILYWFSSSIIKGFALTLAVGVLVSLFTAIVVTRTVLRLITVWGLPAKFPKLFLDSSKS